MAVVEMATIMKWTRIAISIALTLLLSEACRGPESSRSRLEWLQLVGRARAQVMDESTNLDTTSREIIRTNDPRLFVVQLPFGANDYRFVWTISSNRAVELRGYGDFRKLDGASVAIREFRAYNR